jgi:hypothetical protein
MVQHEIYYLGILSENAVHPQSPLVYNHLPQVKSLLLVVSSPFSESQTIRSIIRL